MSQNPLAGLVTYIADTESLPPAPTWAVIASMDPLQVRYPGNEEPLEVTPLSLAPLQDLAVGRRVLTQHIGTTLVILGVTHGGALDVPPPPPPWTALPPMNGWTNYTAFGSLSARMEGDIVRLAGVVRGGPSGPESPIASLPPSMRPSSTRLILAAYGASSVDARVSTTGSLYLSSDTPGYVSFEGTTYRI